MNKIKRIAALIIGTCLLFNLCAFADSEVESETDLNEIDLPVIEQSTSVQTQMDFTISTPSDIVGTEYQEAVLLLSQLKILDINDDELFLPEKLITRAEAAAIAIGLLGLGGVAESHAHSRFYNDVSLTDEYAGHISLATTLKIINGDGDGRFRPDDHVNYEEFLKILVCAIGYDTIAEARGGFPFGYLIVAQEQGITRDIPLASGTDVNRGTVALYVYNSLRSELLTSKYTNQGVEYFRDLQGGTVLEKIFSIVEQNGVIVANEITGLANGGNKTVEGKVKVSISANTDATYNVGRTNAKDLLGYDVRLYVRTDPDNRDEIVSVIAKNTNTVTTINMEDITTPLQVDSGGGSIEYTPDNLRSRMARIDSNAYIIYNQISEGVLAGISDDDLKKMFNTLSGEILLLDNTGGGRANVVFITSYENYVVSRVYPDDLKITLKSNSNHQRREIELDENKSSFSIIKNGKAISFESIKENDIITLVQNESNGSEIKTLYVSDNILEDEVQELITGTVGVSYVMVGGNQYKLSYDANIIPTVGNLYALYLNVFEEIVYFDVLKNLGEDYAYLVGVNKESDVSGNLELQVVMSDGELKLMKSRNKILFNSVPTPSGDVFNALQGKSQLIKCAVNSEGLISMIKTAGTLTANQRYDESRFVMNDSNTDTANTLKPLYYKATSPPRVAGLYALPSDCIVFWVPLDDDGNIKTDSIRASHNTSVFSNDVLYKFEIFDVDKNMSAKAIVSYGVDKDNGSKEGALGWNAGAMVIDRIAHTLDKDGGRIHKIYGLKDGKEIALVVADEVSDNTENQPDTEQLISLPRGSMVQYKINLDDEIDEYRVIYRPDGTTPGISAPGVKKWSTEGDIKNVELSGIYATADAISDDVLVVTIDGGSAAAGGGVSTDTLRTFSIPDSVRIYVFNKQLDLVKVGTKGDISPAYGALSGGSTLFMRTNKDELREVLVIK